MPTVADVEILAKTLGSILAVRVSVQAERPDRSNVNAQIGAT